MATAHIGKIGKEDLKSWDGKTRTFQRRSATGGYLDLHAFDLYGIDVIQICGDGDTATEEEINEAITLAGSNTRSLWLAPVTWTIGANVTLPKNVYLVAAPGALISVSSGCTLTIYSPDNICAQPNQQIFSGSGTVAFTKPGTVYPNWWAENTTPGTTDMSAALQTAITATGIVELLPETYLSDQSTFASDVWIRGHGADSIIKIKASTNDYLLARSGTSATNNFKAQDFAIDGNKANNAGAGGIQVVGENIEISGIYAYNCGRPAIYVGDNIATACKGVMIHHNYIDNSGEDDAWGAIAIVSGTDITVDHNVIRSTDGQQYYAIHVEPNQEGTYERIVISGNVCQGEISVDFNNSTTSGKYITVNNNVIDCSAYDGTQAASVKPIQIRNADFVTVNDNYGKGGQTCDKYGMYLADLNYFTIHNNIFEGYPQAGNEYGIYLVDTISNYGTIHSNVFRAVSGTLTRGVYAYDMLAYGRVYNNIGSGVTYPESVITTTNNTCGPYHGVATNIADGGTITHGLEFIPTWAIVTPSTSGEFVSVTGLSVTTITVAIKKHDNSAGTTQTLYWMCGT